MEFWINGKKSIGSGSLVKSNHLPIVATAAHCLFDWEEQKFYENIAFLPYYNNFTSRLSPLMAIVPKGWAEQGIVDYDTGFIILNNWNQGIDYNQLSITLRFNLPRELDYTIIGFQNKLFPSKLPFICKGPAEKDIYKYSTMQGVYSKGKSGVSGGPWFTYYEGEYIQNSVSSLSFKSVKNMIWGPYWGDVLEQAYLTSMCQDTISSDIVIHKY
ncbi:trypsin-like serine peptidase [Paucisalibacillus globulus]|uniref:trypsin-like serine peptidase n=1 Tax=Paucisalibacillus globulus TaxID=351095 RepID=UPI0004273066|nr:hypothetical protein [Paucisalibacillus globulus]